MPLLSRMTVSRMNERMECQVPFVDGNAQAKVRIGWIFLPLGPYSSKDAYPLAKGRSSSMAGDLFFNETGLDRGRVQRLVDESLKDADDGELFLEYRQSETFAFDDGRLKAATFDTTQGFGLRAVAGEATGYAHATELSEDALRRAA